MGRTLHPDRLDQHHRNSPRRARKKNAVRLDVHAGAAAMQVNRVIAGADRNEIPSADFPGHGGVSLLL